MRKAYHPSAACKGVTGCTTLCVEFKQPTQIKKVEKTQKKISGFPFYFFVFFKDRETNLCCVYLFSCAGACRGATSMLVVTPSCSPEHDGWFVKKITSV